MKLCFCADSTHKKLVMSKDGSPIDWIDEEIKIIKFMTETKNF